MGVWGFGASSLRPWRASEANYIDVIVHFVDGAVLFSLRSLGLESWPAETSSTVAVFWSLVPYAATLVGLSSLAFQILRPATYAVAPAQMNRMKSIFAAGASAECLGVLLSRLTVQDQKALWRACDIMQKEFGVSAGRLTSQRLKSTSIEATANPEVQPVEIDACVMATV